MTFGVTPFFPDDLFAMVERAGHEVRWFHKRALAERYARAGNAFTVRDKAERIVMCGGAMEVHPQHASLWAVYADELRPKDWAQLLVLGRRFVDGLPHRRVDAAVEASAPMAQRWAERVGLAYETRLAEAAPDGGDMAIFRRIEVPA